MRDEQRNAPTRVVHCKVGPYDVYIGRGGPWGNPWSHTASAAAEHVVATREEAVAAFERDLLADPARVDAARAELRGKVLGCWCHPGQRCHGQVLARVADSNGPIEPAFQDTTALAATIDIIDTLPPIDVAELFGGRRVVCFDIEADALYTDLGVAPLVCLAYSVDGRTTQLVGVDEAVELFREWLTDPDLVLFGQSVYGDLAVLAQAAYRKAHGRDCVPGFGETHELVHRAYEAGRVVDTEIRTRLTNIRFGPHKASPGLGPVVKQLFGVDIADAKSITGETKKSVLAQLAAATPWTEWPSELLAATPWRYKYGSIAHLPPSEWPVDALTYVADDVRWPWHVYRRQDQLWREINRTKIPDERRQTSASWHLHLLSIPGWLADRERAQRIRELYRKVVVQVDRTLVSTGIIEVTEPEWKIDGASVRAMIVDALGESAKLPDTYAKSNPNPTIDQLLAHCSTDADAVKKALAVSALAPVKVDSKVPARNTQAITTALANPLHPLQALGLWKAKEKLPDVVGDALAEQATCTAMGVLQVSGLLALTEEIRTSKSAPVAQRVFSILGDETPITKKAAKLYREPTLRQREEFASTDKKAVRAAVLESGGFPANVVDAVERCDLSPDEFDSWLAESKSPVLNAYALHTTAAKTISNFLDRLDTTCRVRTTYQTVIESGRVASRAVNVQQFPRDQGKPGHLHIRGCILPDPGHVFIVADYSQLELCALAHVLSMLVRHYAKDPRRKAHAERLLGFQISTTYESSLARAINEGKDCHLLMAAELLGKSYEYVVSLYTSFEAKKKAKLDPTPEESEVAEARQLSKACNFGFPGGLGAKKFIDYAAAYGVPIKLATALFAKKQYTVAWPEMLLYFDYIGDATNNATGLCVVKQLTSNRLRGDCNFTASANSYFQGLAADGAKEALARLINASYRVPSSPLFGCRPSAFVHDEFLTTAPISIFDRMVTRSEKEGPVPMALVEQERLMVEAMQLWIPDILIQAPGKIMKERWSK